MCIVVMVVVVISVVVVSSSKGNEDIGPLDPVLPAAEEDPKAVVRRPGDMAVAVDSASPRPGTACVGLVVVPTKLQFNAISSERSRHGLKVHGQPKAKCFLLVYLCLQTPVPGTLYFAEQRVSAHLVDRSLETMLGTYQAPESQSSYLK